jgi:hypothetical protein
MVAEETTKAFIQQWLKICRKQKQGSLIINVFQEEDQSMLLN